MADPGLAHPPEHGARRRRHDAARRAVERSGGHGGERAVLREAAARGPAHPLRHSLQHRRRLPVRAPVPAPPPALASRRRQGPRRPRPRCRAVGALDGALLSVARG